MYQRLLPVNCACCSLSVQTLLDNQTNDEDIVHQDFMIQNWKNYLSVFKKLENRYINVDFNNVRIRNYKGCQHCTTGIVSRTVCAEVIEVDETMRELIKMNKFLELNDYWTSLSDNDIMSHNMKGKTATEHAIYKMLKGLIDPVTINNYMYIPE